MPYCDLIVCYNLAASCYDSSTSEIIKGLLGIIATVIGAVLGAITTWLLKSSYEKRTKREKRQDVAKTLLQITAPTLDRLSKLLESSSLKSLMESPQFVTESDIIPHNISELDLETITIFSKLNRELFILEEFHKKVSNDRYFHEYSNALEAEYSLYIQTHIRLAYDYAKELYGKLQYNSSS